MSKREYPGMSECCGKSHCDCDTKPFYSKNEARILLKQQREICAEKIKGGYNLDPLPISNRVNEMVYDDIINAPSPTL